MLRQTTRALCIALCCVALPAGAAKIKAGGYTVNIDAGNGGKLSGNVSGPHCKNLQLDIWTTRWGHAVIQVKNVGQSRKFFSGAAGVYGRGPAPEVANISARCQD